MKMYNVCIAKKYKNEKGFTKVGIAFHNSTKKNENIKIKIDISVIITPEDEIYLFPMEKK